MTPKIAELIERYTTLRTDTIAARPKLDDKSTTADILAHQYLNKSAIKLETAITYLCEIAAAGGRPDSGPPSGSAPAAKN